MHLSTTLQALKGDLESFFLDSFLSSFTYLPSMHAEYEDQGNNVPS